MLNKVILIGRLTKDPELKFTPGSGIAVSHLNLAVDRDYVDQDGKRPVDFITIVCWRKIAETVANNLTKGRLVAVSGAIQTNSYTAQDGTKRYKTEVVADEVKFLDSKKKEAENNDVNLDTGFDDFVQVDIDEDLPF